MDFHLKQWRNQQHESDQHHHHQQTPAKIPKLLLEPQQQQPSSGSAAAALPLFVPEPNIKLSHMSAFPDLTLTPTRFPKMASYFSLAQWHELELQALIFRHMLAGADVPAELLHPIKKSILNTHPFYLHHSPLHHYPHYQPTLLQPGYWGRGGMDPEPGRCRRTDGKKWRCSRDIVAGHKYCERHMHRGRNRSRKPVETPTPAATAIGGGGGGSSGGCGTMKTITPITAPPLTAVSGGTHFALSEPSASIDLLQLNHSFSEPLNQNSRLFEPPQNEKLSSGDGRSDGRILRCFFDDWPRSLPDPENATGSNARPMASSAGLSMSIPGNLSSDISLKLSTGTGDNSESRERPQLSWAAGWGTRPVAPMGGPLAEALRSSTPNSSTSPTSVLHELQRGSASDTSYVSA